MRRKTNRNPRRFSVRVNDCITYSEVRILLVDVLQVEDVVREYLYYLLPYCQQRNAAYYSRQQRREVELTHSA